jgi:3-oxoacyl-[acyl-carrier protein] reductase
VDATDEQHMSEGRRVVAITGGTKGIGLAVAEAFAAQGDLVAVTGGSDTAAMEEAKAILRGACPEAEARLLDARDGPATRAWVEDLVSCRGRLDVAVANAGIISPRPFLEIDEDQLHHVVGVHLTGAFLFLQAAARAMVRSGEGGSLIAVTAPAALRGGVGVADYAAAKGGVVAMTKCLARELADHGIRVNAVLPVAETAMTEALREFRGLDAETWQRQYPGGRMPRPADIAGVFVFLASEAARYITGEVVAVDAGRSM